MLGHLKPAAAALLLACSASFAQNAPTTFTYQGALDQSGTPVNATLPMTFRLYDAASGGNTVGPLLSNASVPVTEGVFSQPLDFGAVPAGVKQLWLQVTVDGFAMSPRTAIAASPYSLQTRGIHVDSAGRVGIGTQTPTADLTVEKSGATLRVASTNAASPAAMTMAGDLPGPLGGVRSRIDFNDASNTLRFGIQNDNAFGSEYLTLRSSALPSGLLRVREDGLIAIGDLPSVAALHLTDADIGVYNAGMLNETMAIEDSDSVLGLYSSNSGSFGSAIVFGEVINDAVTNKWGIVRTTSNTSPELRVTYGSNTNYAQNPTALAFVPGGIRFPGGTVQQWAPVADADSLSTYNNIVTVPPIYTDPVIVTIDTLGQRVLLTAFLHLRVNSPDCNFQLVYRRRDTGLEPWIALLPQRTVGGTSTPFENPILATGQTTIVDSLVPGEYEFAFWINGNSSSQETTARFFGVDMTALVF